LAAVPPTSTRGFAYRPALDGTRALAVAGVLLFHGGVGALPGGFLGVDAFFVLSGYLITSLLLVELDATGRVRLGRFWSRRARRLLPALLVVLVATVVGYRSVLASDELRLLRGDALAALGYGANWRMIYRGTDYFTQNAAPSALQHTWSLGIEEQFYLLWPLIVVGILAVSRRRVALAAVCIGGAAASAVAGALLYRPGDVSRAYFGTDTRAQALLIGCALAVVLAHASRHPRRTVERRSARKLASVEAIGLLGFGAVAWLWLTANGEAAWLYRGGLTVGALGVAAVIASVVLAPGDPLGRLLALAPLVWLGRISYGVYLWHWPLFGLLTADRTGLAGASLLLVRVAATLVAATASFWLIERPVRAGVRWRLGRAWTARTAWVRPAWLVAGGLCVVATATVVVVGTRNPIPSGRAGKLALTTATPTVSVGATPPPIARPGRHPGSPPRITFFGDSVSWTIGTYLPEHPGVDVTVRAIQGCGIVRINELRQRDQPGTNYTDCSQWDGRWATGVEQDDPDVAVILLDRWELLDRLIDGAYHHVGEPVYDAYLTQELETALRVTTAHGAHIALLTAPYTHRSERPDGGLYVEDQPQRVDAWNALLRSAAARHPGQVTIIDLNRRACPDGRFTWNAPDGVRLRSDGLHFTADGVKDWIAPWLMPKVTALAVGAPMPN
jgi:peptidoglycan/LPS O-acetylase OafA/YrhL